MSAKNSDDFELPTSEMVVEETTTDTPSNNVRSIKPQFASEPESSEQTNKPELSEEQPIVAKPKQQKRKQRAKEKAPKKGKGVFGKLVLSTLVIGALGGGVFVANETGVISELPHFFGSNVDDELISNIKTEHSQLLMRFNSLEGRYDKAAVSATFEELRKSNASLQDQIDKLKVAQEKQQSNHKSEIAELSKSYDSKLQRYSTALSKLQGALAEIESGVDSIDSEVKSIKRRLTDSEQNQSRLSKRIAENVNSEVGHPTTQTPNSKSVNNEPTTTKTVVNEWAGLRLTNVFSWGSKKIALLSDNLGGTFQVPAGEVLGDYKATFVGENYIELMKLNGNEIVTLEKK